MLFFCQTIPTFLCVIKVMFRTEINSGAYHHTIKIEAPILSMGSCFAQIIGDQLSKYKFRISANPFGIIYNPISIFQLLEYACLKKYPENDGYLQNQGIHLNYYFHSDISDLDPSTLREKITQKINETHHFLNKTEWLLMTFGTAYVYQLRESKNIVANCHKMPAQFFEKRLLTESEIVEGFDRTYQLLKAINPDLKLILTVSPVRHIRDELVQNTISKSLLRLAVDKICKKTEEADYFPSFEMMIDDLRDYRFYGPDLIHPNELAKNYIWEKFMSRYMDQDTRDFIKEWSKIENALHHKPFHPKSAAHQTFIRKTIEKLNQFKDKVDVSQELKFLKSQLV